MGLLVDPLKGGEGEEQFLGQKGGKGWRLERIGVRRVIGHFLVDQNRIRRGRVSRGRDSFAGVKRRQ